MTSYHPTNRLLGYDADLSESVWLLIKELTYGSEERRDDEIIISWVRVCLTSQHIYAVFI